MYLHELVRQHRVLWTVDRIHHLTPHYILSDCIDEMQSNHGNMRDINCVHVGDARATLATYLGIEFAF